MAGSASRHRVRDKPLNKEGITPVRVEDSIGQQPLSKTISWTEIPDWLKDNEYILTGYRRVQHSWRGCVASMFLYSHNETVNIHTHLFGAVLFGFLLATNHSVNTSQHDTATWIDAVMVSIFLFSAIWCLASSSMFHTLQCHSKEVAERVHCLDYSGIVVLIVGSFFPCIYYSFWCEPFYQFLYTSAIMTAGLGAAYIVLSPGYASPAYRGTRTAVFIALGLCGVVPVTHALMTHGLVTLDEEMGFRWLIISAGLYISGALIYANRIPEKLSPGRFDYFFASHQIFHVNVVLAAIAHYVCILKAQSHWHATNVGVCPL